MVDGTFEMGLGEGGMDGLTGEEYFETNPNDTSYELGETDNTNRDLMDTENVPIDMRSPDVTQIMEAEKQTFDIVNTEILEKNLKDDNLVQTQVQL